MGSSYTNTKRQSSKPTKLQKLLRYTLYIVAACITIAAGSTIVSFFRTEEIVIVEAPLFPYGSIEELAQLDIFQTVYLQVNCNADLLESTRTIRVTGRMGSGDNSQPFSLIKKRPDQMLFTIDRGSHDMTFGVTGSTVWRRIRMPQQEDQITRIEGDEATAWLDQREFFDRIITATQGRGTLQSVEIATWQGAPSLKVTVIAEDNSDSVEVFVNPQTMYPEAELKQLKDGSLQKTIFSNYRNIKGMPIPFKMESFTDDKPENTITLKSASINSGVLSDLFEMPQSLITE